MPRKKDGTHYYNNPYETPGFVKLPDLGGAARLRCATCGATFAVTRVGNAFSFLATLHQVARKHARDKHPDTVPPQSPGKV